MLYPMWQYLHTTGNFKRIEAAEGKGAAIAAYQNKLKAYKAKK